MWSINPAFQLAPSLRLPPLPLLVFTPALLSSAESFPVDQNLFEDVASDRLQTLVRFVCGMNMIQRQSAPTEVTKKN